MSSARRVLLEEAAIAALLAVGALLEHRSAGVELLLITLGVALLGPAFRRWLVLRGRAAPASRFLFLLELAAFTALIRPAWDGEALGPTGILRYPPGRWGHELAGLAGLVLAFPALRAEEKAPPRATRADEAGVLLLALATAGIAWLTSRHEPGLPLPFVLLVVLALEAWGPAAPRSAADAARRAARFALLAAAAALRDYEQGGPVAEGFLLAVSTILSVIAGLDVLFRGLRGAPEIELVRRRRRAVVRIVAVLLPLALLWVAGEVLLRFVPNPYREHTLGQPEGVTWHVPGGRYVYLGPMLGHRETDETYGNEFVWNKEGFHDLDREHERPKGRARVVVIGDSYVDGYQLPLEALVHSQLERRLAPRTPAPCDVEVMAIGAAGWGQVQELGALRERVEPYAPDLVVLEFLCGNDVRNNDPVLEDLANAAGKTLARRTFALALSHRLFFTALVADKLHLATLWASGIPPEIDSEVFRAENPHAREWAAAWKRTDELVGEIHEETRRLGAELVVAIFTSDVEIRGCYAPEAVPRGWDARLPARRMLDLCKSRGIPCLDLAPRFAARPGPDRERVHMKWDGHWSRVGHRWAAEEAERFLCDETDVWKRVLDRTRAR